MDTAQQVVTAAVTVIVVVTLLSGPLVDAVDLTTEPESAITDDLGEGSADVTVVSFPENVSISKGRYGSEQYFLRVPDATVRLSNVSGQPLLKYNVRIPEMGYSSGTTQFVSSEYEGLNKLTIERTAFDESEITPGQYNATLSVSLRANGNETVIEEREYTFEVEQ